MSIEELKQEIEKRTGVPAAMLPDDADGALNRARDLLLFKHRHKPEVATNADLFGKWLHDQAGYEKNDSVTQELDALSDIHREIIGGYPDLKDGGTPYQMVENDDPAGGDPRKSFEMWFRDTSAFNPRKEGNWTRFCDYPF